MGGRGRRGTYEAVQVSNVWTVDDVQVPANVTSRGAVLLGELGHYVQGLVHICANTDRGICGGYVLTSCMCTDENYAKGEYMRRCVYLAVKGGIVKVAWHSHNTTRYPFKKLSHNKV